MAATLGKLANIRRRQGDLPVACALAEQSLRLFERAGDLRGQALTLGNLARVAKEVGDDATALDAGSRSADGLRSLGDAPNLLVGRASLTGTALHMGRTECTREMLRKSL